MKLFESIMKNFDNDSLGLLGAVLGEHEVKIRDGVEAAVPEILCAIGSQTKSEEGRNMPVSYTHLTLPTTPYV